MSIVVVSTIWIEIAKSKVMIVREAMSHRTNMTNEGYVSGMLKSVHSVVLYFCQMLYNGRPKYQVYLQDLMALPRWHMFMVNLVYFPRRLKKFDWLYTYI